MKRFILLIVSIMVLSSLFAMPVKDTSLRTYLDDVAFGSKSFNKSVSLRRTMDEVDWVLEETWDSVTTAPDGWTVIDGDGEGEWQFGFMEGFPAYSPSQYAAIGFIDDSTRNDDWLITPAISVEAGYILEIWYSSYNPGYLEQFEILISTTGTDTDDFTDELYSEEEVPASWQSQVLALDAYAGSDIYIAIHHTSLDEHMFFVDDFRVGGVAGIDIALEDNGLVYSVNPDSGYVPSIVVTNNGSSEDDVEVVCHIMHDDEVVYTEVITVSDLTYGVSDTLTFPTFIPDGDLVYYVEFSVDFEGDEVEENNTATNIFTSYNTVPKDVFVQNFVTTSPELDSYSDLSVEGLNRLSDSLENIAYVNYHLAGYVGGTTEFNDDYALEESWQVFNQLRAGNIPVTYFNGYLYISLATTSGGYGYDVFRTGADMVTASYSPFELDLDVVNTEGNTLEITADIEQIAEIIEDHDYALRYVIYEEEVPYVWGSDSLTLDNVHHVARALIGDSAGISIDTSSVTDVQTYETDSEWRNARIYVVAYVQNNTTNVIYQAKVVKAFSNPDHDLAVRGSRDIIEVDPFERYTPDVTVFNNGLMTESFDVSYVIQEEGGDDILSSGSTTLTDLAAGESQLVEFDDVVVESDKVYVVRYEVMLDGDPSPDDNTYEEMFTTYGTLLASVLVQKFTHTHCPACPSAALAMEEFSEANPGAVIAAYHPLDFQWGGNDAFYFSSAYDIAEMYGVTLYPTIIFNGLNRADDFTSADDYREKYLDASVRFVPYDVELSLTSIDTNLVRISTEVIQAAKVPELYDVSLRFVVIERNIDFDWGVGTEMHEMDFVVRAFIDGSFGTSVDNEVGSYTVNDMLIFRTIDYENIENLYVIAYIQNDVTNEIYCVDQLYLDQHAIEEDKIEMPTTFDLTCSPNPFNAATEINFSVPENGNYELNVYDINGQHVKSLENGNNNAGTHSVIWNGTDENGATVTSGVYIVNFRQGDTKTSQVISLVK